MTNKWRDFEYFSADEPNPIGKYKQPEVNPRFTKGSGYPEDDVGLTGTKTYGRYIKPFGKKKLQEEIRGCKNTTRGKRFYVDDMDRDPVRTNGRIPVDDGHN
jgi:hypothetical protein